MIKKKWRKGPLLLAMLGCALVLAALAADGMTEVENISLIDRGYERLEETLTALGARIRRV